MTPTEPSKPITDPLAGDILALLQEVAARRESGEQLSDEELCAAHPELMPALGEHLKYLNMAGQAHGASDPMTTDRPGQNPEPLGDSVPGYSIVREIHRGGQGVVYEAIQIATRRKVAIKIMREGPFASRQDRARFEREVQVLAALKHPNIVAVHDSGMAAGIFYFVMDYVSGQPLDRYMAAGRRSVRETLALFQKICGAVNAAHLRGVIHRDLKPGNICIDSAGEPQILDFGLAKVAASETAGESQVMTITGQFVGSLPWASPEQAEGIPSRIDIRTDVYSLGVILYQMLTGKLPYDVVGSFRDVLDRIMRTQPVRPGALRAEIDDEVETIVLKALNKERERRYQSAGELARDIGRYLNGEPIEAKRDSSWYVLRKNLRRYRAAVGVAVVFVVLVALGSVISTVFWRQAASARDQARVGLAAQKRETQRAGDAEKLAREHLARAEKEKKKAESVNEFLTNMFSTARKRNDGRPVTLEEVLDMASQNLEKDPSLAETPEIEISLRSTLAGTYFVLGLNEPADHHYRAALAVCRRSTGEESPEAVKLRADWAWTSRQNPVSEEFCRETLAAARRVLGPGHEATLKAIDALANNLMVKARSGSAEERLAEAERLLREALDADSNVLVDRWRCIVMYHLAAVLQAQRRGPEAEALRRQAAKLDKTGSGMAHFGWWGIADSLLADAKLQEAEPILRQAYEVYRQTYGEERDLTGSAAAALADVLDRQGKARHADVEALYKARVQSLRASPGDQHPATLKALQSLGGFYAGHQRYAEAEPIYRDLWALCQRVKGDADESVLRAMAGLASALEGQKKLAEAEAVYGQAIASLHNASARIADLLSAEAELARFYRDQGRFAEAEKLYLQCYQDARRLLGKSEKTAGYLQALMILYVAWGQPDRCERVGHEMQQYDVKTRVHLVGELMRTGIDHLEALFPTCRNLDAPQLADPGYSGWTLCLIGRVVAFSGDFDRAVRIMRIPAERTQSTNGGWWYNLGWAELLAGRAEQARADFIQAKLGTNEAAAFMSQYFLGEVPDDALIGWGPGTAWHLIGERRLISDDREGACQAYQRSVEFNSPDHSPYARLRLRQLEQNSSALPPPLPPADRFWERPNPNGKPADLGSKYPTSSGTE